MDLFLEMFVLRFVNQVVCFEATERCKVSKAIKIPGSFEPDICFLSCFVTYKKLGIIGDEN